jgi:exopolyphosphatase/guanosine-5'-triphosphate,3'-diphosphate pyrophosphatase
MGEQVAAAWAIGDERARQFLSWGARMHEVGLSVAYSGYHKHGAYLMTHADMPGFSRDDQRLLASIVLGHRRKISRETFANVDPADAQLALRLCLLVRVAARLNRARSSLPLPAMQVVAARDRLQIDFASGWLDAHPLTKADLEDEVEALKAVGVQLKFG